MSQVLAEQQHLSWRDGLVAEEHVERVNPTHFFVLRFEVQVGRRQRRGGQAEGVDEPPSHGRDAGGRVELRGPQRCIGVGVRVGVAWACMGSPTACWRRELG